MDYETVKRGICKREIETLDIKNDAIRLVVKEALLNNGFDISIKPLYNGQGFIHGEIMTVYRGD